MATARPKTVREVMEHVDKATGDRQRLQEAMRQAGPARTVAAMRMYALVKERQRQGLVSADIGTATRQIIAADLAEAGTRELVGFARRLGPGDLAQIDELHSRGGWPAVRKALEDVGLSASALTVADGAVENGGVAGLRTAVTTQIAVENRNARQEAASSELSTWGRKASAADVARLRALEAQGGPQLAAQALVAEAGLSRDAAEVALHTIQALGLEGFAGKLTERIQQEDTVAQARSQHEAVESQAAEAARKTIEKWTPKDGDTRGTRSIKEGSPLVAVLRDPAFHKSATAWYAARAEKLKASGLGLKKGESPGEALIRLALMAGEGGERVANENPRHLLEKKTTSEEALAALSDAFGEGPEVVKGWLAQVHQANDHHELRARLAKSDDATRAHLGPPAEKSRRAKDRDSLQSAMEKAAEKVGVKDDDDEPYLANDGLMATIALADGQKVVPASRYAAKEVRSMIGRREKDATSARSVRGAMERAWDQAESTGPAPEASEAPTSSSGSSVRESMDAAWAANGGGTDDDQ